MWPKSSRRFPETLFTLAGLNTISRPRLNRTRLIASRHPGRVCIWLPSSVRRRPRTLRFALCLRFLKDAGVGLPQSLTGASFLMFIHSLSDPLTDRVTPEGVPMVQWLTGGSMKAQRAGAAGKGRDGDGGRDSAKAASGHQRPPRDCDGFGRKMGDCVMDWPVEETVTGYSRGSEWT
jgi:hypothetical protein